MGWKDVSLKEKLASRFSFPVLIYNNRVRLLAEFAIQPDLASRNILYLNLANGVGSTVYMNGRLVHGATGRYGEIGHIVVDPNGPQCGCGHLGCLEAFISGPALAGRIKSDFLAGIAQVFGAMLSEGDMPTPEEVLSFWAKAVEKGDEYALTLQKEVAERFAESAVMSINCYDPEVVILAGYISLLFPDYFAQAIRQKMTTGVYDNPLRSIEIMPARAGEDAVIKGVAAAVLQDSLAPAW
jgi:glucokinase